ncbi:Fc.00g108890.m01.CDS01 [Cosmosporella sp. VM-42]
MDVSQYDDLDDLELEAVGYQREMPRQFTVLSLGALSFTLTCTWLGVGSSIGIGITDASAAGTIWSLPIAGFMTVIVSLGMAELSSAYPVAGAQYYWSFMVASDEYKPFAAYFNGWMSILGWWMGASSVSNFVASMILSIATLWYPEYDYQHWQQWTIYILLIWVAIGFNIFGHALIPLYNKLTFMLSVVVLIATTLSLFICSRNSHASERWMFTDTTTSTGWTNDGMGFLLAICNAVFCFLGSDAGAHLCEEIHNPGRNVPRIIIFPLIMGLITAFPFCCACLFAITDIAAVLKTATGLPLIEIYRQGTGSDVAASLLTALFAFCFFGCLVGNATASSRTLWAVSRDGALPYSRLWMRINRRFKMPMNAMLLSACFVSVYGLIFIGSTNAFSAMVSANVIFLQTSCVIPQAILLYRGRSKVLPERYFSLGRYGVLINSVAVVWVLFLDVVFCLPTAMPVTAQNMNYVSVVCVGFGTFIVGLWYTSKKGVFTGPKVDMEKLAQRRQAALHNAGVEVDITALEGVPAKVSKD